MAWCTTIPILTVLVICIQHISSLPIDNTSKSQEKSQAEIRASLITKDNFKDYYSALQKRQKKSSFKNNLPKPFVISTQLNVGPTSTASGNRRGRSFQDADGSTVVEGIRVPDDESDAITHRNGRFINNVFVSNDALVPKETVVSWQPSIQEARQPRAYGGNQWNVMSSRRVSQPRSGLPYPAFNYDDHYRGRTPDLPDSIAVESRQQPLVLRPDGKPISSSGSFSDSSIPNPAETGRDYSYHAGSTNGGRPVYYVVEEQEKLHDDRSPYNFEPADTHTSFTSAIADYTQAGSYNKANDPLGAGPGAAANPGDFIIKEHTYTMCPGCPTFSIPIPIPKSTLLGFGSLGKKPQPKQPPRRAGLPQKEKKKNVQYQYSRNQTFLEKVGDRIWNRYQEVYIPILEKADEVLPDFFDPILDAGQSFLGVEDDENTIEERIEKEPKKEEIEEKDEDEEESSGFNLIPVIIGGVSAAALGVAAYLSATPHEINLGSDAVTGRQARLLNHRPLQVASEALVEEANQIVESIQNANKKYATN